MQSLKFLSGRRPTLFLCASLFAFATAPIAFQASAIPAAQLLNPQDLLKLLHSSRPEKPLIFQVGSRVMFEEAHIPDSEYVGAASTDAGLDRLRKRVALLPHNQFIVLYCGCCPWTHCPNVKPALDALHTLGFTNLKVLYLANNFGADWVNQGYPVAKGE